MAWTRKARSGKYEGQFRDRSGRTRSAGTFARKADAKRAAEDRERDARAGLDVSRAATRRTFEDFAKEVFSRLERDRAASGLDRDRSHLRKHVLPEFGAMRVVDIDSGLVNDWVGKLEDKGLAPRTIKDIYGVLRQIMMAAVDARPRLLLPDDNPCTPRAIKLPGIPKTEPRFLDHHEVRALFEATDERYAAAVLVGAWGGLRWEEMAALKPDRVDFLRRRLSVFATVVREGNRSVYQETTKTDAGRRQSTSRTL